MRTLTQPLAVLIAILCVAAIGLHGLANQAPVPLRKPLDRLPREINGMTGRDTGIDPEILRVLGSGEFLTRVYRGPTSAPIYLYIAYYPKQERSVAIHSPKHCLPGSGWEPVSAGRARLELSPGQTVVTNRYLVQKETSRQLVYYWYQIHGRIVASEYWGKIYQVLDAIRLGRTDASLIRVSIPLESGTESVAEKQMQAFIQELYPMLADYLPE